MTALPTAAPVTMPMTRAPMMTVLRFLLLVEAVAVLNRGDDVASDTNERGAERLGEHQHDLNLCTGQGAPPSGAWGWADLAVHTASSADSNESTPATRS